MDKSLKAVLKELNNTLKNSPIFSIKPPKDNFVDDHLADMPRLNSKFSLNKKNTLLGKNKLKILNKN